MNVIMSLAGQSSRFKKAGYSLPKPYIDICGKPMFQHAIEGMKIDGVYHLIVLKEYYDLTLKYANSFLRYFNIHVLNDTKPDVIHALFDIENIFNSNSEHLFIAVCDQIAEWDSTYFVSYCVDNQYDGVITVFDNNLEDYSYAIIEEDNVVKEVQEKIVISNNALSGIHYWRYPLDCFYSFHKMVQTKRATRGAYYVAPSYNELIDVNKDIRAYYSDEIHMVGTPRELQEYELRISNSGTAS